MTLFRTAALICALGLGALSMSCVEPSSLLAGNLLANAVEGQSYEAALESCICEGAVWRVVDGELPEGLTLSADGVISGTPTESGEFAFTVSVGLCVAPDLAEQTLELTVIPRLELSISLPDGETAVEYFAQAVASGGVPPYVFEELYMGKFVYFRSDGTVSGLPYYAFESRSFTFTVSDSGDPQQVATTTATWTVVQGEVIYP